MTSQTFVLLSSTINFGVPIILGIRELILLSRGGRGGDEPPPEERLPRAPKPLPECLLPRPDPVRSPPRVRVLEDA